VIRKLCGPLLLQDAFLFLYFHAFIFLIREVFLNSVSGTGTRRVYNPPSGTGLGRNVPHEP
jgi:hypothetical protein